MNDTTITPPRIVLAHYIDNAAETADRHKLTVASIFEDMQIIEANPEEFLLSAPDAASFEMLLLNVAMTLRSNRALEHAADGSETVVVPRTPYMPEPDDLLNHIMQAAEITPEAAVEIAYELMRTYLMVPIPPPLQESKN